MKTKTLRFSLAVLACLLASPKVYPDVIDNMDSLTGWSFSAAGGTTLLYGLGTGYGTSGNSILASFDLSGGDWVQFGKTSFGNPDFSGGDAISLNYRGDGNTNNIEIKITDADGDIFAKTLNNVTNTSNVWSLAVIPLTSFSLWTDSKGLPFGNGTMNWNNISKYTIGITSSTGGEGTLEADQLQTYQANTPGNQSVDDCKSIHATQLKGDASQSVAIAIDNTSPSDDPIYNPSVVADNHYKITYVSTTSWMICADETITPNISSATYTYLNFYMKLGTGAEKLHIELITTAGEANSRIDLSAGTYAASTSWQFFSIPLTAFGVIPGNITELKFVVDPVDAVPITRTVYLDRIWFSTSKTPVLGAGPIKLLNGFDEEVNKYTYPWYGDRDAQMSISSVDGLSGKALHVDYAFNSGQWMLMEKGTGLNCALGKGFRFKILGTGVPQNLEFKIKDKNNVEYIKKFYNFTNTGGDWKTATALSKEFSLFSKGNGGNTTLDLKNIGAISVAISRNTSTSGGIGAILLDNIETITDSDFSADRPGHMLSNVSVNNNPFSPNGDGVRDTAVIGFTLTDYAHIFLDIYDLAGQVVRRIDGGDTAPGTYTNLKWDGLNDNGNMSRNGLYIYRLRAKNPDNQEDSVKNLIEVLK